MRKAIIILVSAIALLALVSCSLEQITGSMDKMGGNVFGLEADTSKVDAAEEKIGSSVNCDGEKAEIDWSAAASVADDYAVLSDSVQLRETFSEKMQEKVTEDATDAAKVSEAMKDKLDDSAGLITTTINADKELSAQAMDNLRAVGNAMTAIRHELDDTPTKADLVMVALVTDLADKAIVSAEIGKTPEEERTPEQKAQLDAIATDAKSAIDVLKAMGCVSVLQSSMEELDLSAVVSTEKGLDPADTGDGSAQEIGDKVAKAVNPILARIRLLMEENGSYSAEAHRKLYRDLLSLRLAYEVFASSADRNLAAETPSDAVGNAIALLKGERTYPLQTWARTSAGLTSDDVIYYVLSIIVTETGAGAGLHTVLADYLDNGAPVKNMEYLTRFDGTLAEFEEKTFYNTSAVLLDASGWGKPICNLAKDNLTVGNVLNLFHAH